MKNINNLYIVISKENIFNEIKHLQDTTWLNYYSIYGSQYLWVLIYNLKCMRRCLTHCVSSNPILSSHK